MAKILVPEAKISKADIEQMPFPDNSFDFVVMVDVFPYLLDFDKEQTNVKWTSPKFWWNAAKSLTTHLLPKSEDKKVEETIKKSAEEEIKVKEAARAKVKV